MREILEELLDQARAGGPAKPIRISDLTPRDAQQCKLATRVSTDDLLPLCARMNGVGFHAVEVWGGATYDVCLRYLREDPWERLRRIKAVMPDTKLQMLFRGQNIVGYRPRSDRVVKTFAEKSIEHGIEVFRVFDSLNDNRNIQPAVEALKALGGEVHAEISYMVSPVHTFERWMDYARELAEMEPDWISFKDATGVLKPFDAYRIVKGIKEVTGGEIPVLLHCHDQSGTAMMCHMMAVLAGVDMLDTVLSPLAFGSSHPATESVVAALQETPFDSGIALEPLDELADITKQIRRKYRQYETDYGGVNAKVLIHKIPGGMISNMVAQLEEAGAADRMEDALAAIPKVAADLGYPPLLTPSSQIVGVQAVLNVVTGSEYGTITKEVRDYVAGRYGRPPGEISPALVEAVLGDGPASDYSVRPAELADPGEWDRAGEELGELCRSDEDRLLYVLFPMQAREYLQARASGELVPPDDAVEPEVDSLAEELETDRVPVEFDIVYHGEKFNVAVEGASTYVEPGKARRYYIRVDGRLEEIQLKALKEAGVAGRALVEGGEAGNGIPKASLPGDASPPMPGRVVSIFVEVGQEVADGDTVALVEAMKMESEIHAPIAGKVSHVFASRGDQVEPDDALLRIEAELA